MFSLTDVFSPLIGVVIGLVMGLTGAGGGILAVPALVYSQGWSMQQAMPVALLAVTGGAILGALEGFLRKLVRYRAGMLMACAGSVPTWLGVQLAARLSQTMLMRCFALVLLLVAVRLYFQMRTHVGDERHPSAIAHINQDTGRFDWNLPTLGIISAIGALSGFMTGLLGVGGGFIIVPMLRHFTNVSMHGAVATSLFVISLVGSIGIASAWSHGTAIPAGFAFLFVAATAAGMLLARRIAASLPAQAVQAMFILLLLGVAASLLVRAAA